MPLLQSTVCTQYSESVKQFQIAFKNKCVHKSHSIKTIGLLIF